MVLIAVWFVWRVIRTIGRFQREPEPPDQVGDREPVKRGPKTGADAVALDEPDDEDNR